MGASSSGEPLSGVGVYGLASVTGLIPWERTSLNTLAIGMAATVPVVGLALYLSGGSISYVEPLLVCSLLYAAFFFPARWAWPLSIELVLIAGADDEAEGRAPDRGGLAARRPALSSSAALRSKPRERSLRSDSFEAWIGRVN